MFQDFPHSSLDIKIYLRYHFVLSYYLFWYIDWVLISAKLVEDCISVENLNTLNTDLQSILQNINKFAVG